MTLPYGFARCKVTAIAGLKSSRHKREIQYHLHASLKVGGDTWDVAVNVGTNDADDLLQYKLVYDYHHPVTQTLGQATLGKNDLTGTAALPALDFVRSDVLAETGGWRLSEVMDGSDHPEPAASLLRLFSRAQTEQADVYIFGRFYAEGDGIHDTHLNQGSRSSFIHRAGDDSNDHNDIWQDGAVLVNLGQYGWAAYFAAFEQQYVPTDDLGNPSAAAQPIK